MGNVDYKKKYLELRSVLNNVIDQAFKQGYQVGAKDAQMDAMAQQVQQQNDMMAQMSGGMADDPDDPNGAPMDDGSGMPPDQQGDLMNGAAEAHGEQAGSELEQGMAELEAELGKSERNEEALGNVVANLNRSLKKMQEATTLKKSAAAIRKLKLANQKVKKTSIGYKHNLNKTHKRAVSKQQELVDGILKKWEVQEKEATTDILAALKDEGKK